jgi:hypothetical protein
MKQTQLEKVKAELKYKGYISRNECLKNYISRLSAIIYDLKEEGMEFETKKVGGDYRYYLVDRARDQVDLDLAVNNNLKYV